MESQQPVSPDYTTPAAILGGTLLSVGMIGAIIWGPADLADKMTPILTAILAVVVPGILFVINQRVTATHKAVNSQMDAFKAYMALSAEQRVEAAKALCTAEGHAAGLAEGAVATSANAGRQGHS